MNTKSIIIIDPAVKEPATPCFNRFVNKYPHISFTYQLPALVGTKTFDLTIDADAMIVLGSASFVSDKQEWQEVTFNYLKSALEKGIPVLGCCFGLQLVVDGFGGTVDFVSEDQNKEAGLRVVEFSQNFENINSGQIVTLAVNHRQEIKALPSCFEVLASSGLIDIEVVNHKSLPFIGIQGHPEASDYFMTEYIGNMSTDEILEAQAGGDEIIKNFLKFAKIGNPL